MNGCELIVCESTSRWAGALRLALARDSLVRAGGVRLYETRQLNDLTQRLTERSHSLAAIEVREDNVGEVLGWLTWATGRFGRVRCVALLDRSLVSDERDVVDALCEAGALEVARSPRQLHSVVELFRRQATLSSRVGSSLRADLPWRELVWQSLPWQAARSRVG
jgi:hypothetical protein